MRVRVLLFASLRERSGAAARDLDLPGDADLEAVRAALERETPGLLASGAFATAVNGVYERDRRRALRDGDEVAFLPPVSGG